MGSTVKDGVQGLEFDLEAVQDAGELGTALRRLLRRARQSTGRRLTCRELSEETGYSRSAVNNWLEGRSLPSADGLDDLLLALNATRREQQLLATARDLIEDRRRATARAAHDPSGGRGFVPRELPPDVNAFIGRAAELGSLDELLKGRDQSRPGDAEAVPVVISAVSGTAGVGKTALAVRWAHRTTGFFPDGQLYVNLRGFDPDQPLSAEEVLARVLRTLGVASQNVPLEAEERAALYRSLLSGKQMLIVLDNVASAEQVRPLLPGAGPMVIVTSRDSLAGLVARDGAYRLDLDLLPVHDAVALLRALIGDRVDAEPTAAATLAEACAKLPIALRVAAELAVARPSAGLAELAAELAGHHDRLGLLEAGGDAHTAVRDVFSWSYRSLPAPAARAFRLLGLHPGPDWDRHAAAALTAVAADQIGELLEVLTRAHLIQPGSGARYGMHDMLRAYATHLIADHDGDGTTHLALTGLFDYYLATAAAAMDALFPAEKDRRPCPPPGIAVAEMPDPATARAWLAAEMATLVAVAAFTATHGWPCHATRLAATLNRYLQGGYTAEAITIHTHALHAARSSGDRDAQAEALSHLGITYKVQGRQQQAADWLNQALVLFREIGDRLGEARTLGNLGNIEERQGRYQKAADCYQQVLVLFREAGDRLSEARSLGNLALVHQREGRYQQAADCHCQALVLFREIGDRLGEARTLGNLGDVCCSQGLYQQATGPHQQALALFREIGDRHGEADTRGGLGAVCQQQGKYDQAAGHHQQAFVLFREIGDRYGEAQALTGLGVVCQRQHEYQQAADWHQQALVVFREIGDRGGEAAALNGTGEALLALAQQDQARVCHTAALTLARETGDCREEARTLTGLGVVGRQQTST